MCEEGLHPFQDQVDCARFRAERDMLAQAMERVADDIEHTFLGFEGAEDAPAMRWARQFRAALGSLHAPARDTAMSAHDLLPEEEREAIAWVKEHGGIDDVERFWNCYRTIAGVVGRVLWGAPDMVPSPLSGEQLRDILDRRLMPEGTEWPRYEDGDPVRIGDEFEKAGKRMTVMAVHFSAASCYLCAGGHGEHYVANGERVKRPAPKVLDADGVEIRKGDTVWHVETGERCKVVEADSRSVSVDFRVDGDGTKHTGSILPANLTHRAPVIAADGKPLREGERVWNTEINQFGTVEEIFESELCGKLVRFAYRGGGYGAYEPSKLTHERPVSDSWERLEEDAETLRQTIASELGDYDFDDTGKDSIQTRLIDLVRRARALAERDAK